MAEPLPDWFLTPPGGWTADDMDHLPPEAPRMELIDGAPIVMSPQTRFHSRAIRRLTNALEDQAPADLTADEELTTTLDKHQRPEPDIVVYKDREAEQEDWFEATSIPPEDVILVVEVESPESVFRDREVKPGKYAAAGIPHFWRVVWEDRKLVVHVYELDAITKGYVATGIFRDRLELQVPFPIEINLRKLVKG